MKKGILRPGHVQIRVLDMAEALRHYVDLVGLVETHRDRQGRVYLKGWHEVERFSVVLVGEAAQDDRLRSFAPNPSAVLESWARAAVAAGVQRVIWVVDDEPPACSVGEVVQVNSREEDLPGAVFELDRAESL